MTRGAALARAVLLLAGCTAGSTARGPALGSEPAPEMRRLADEFKKSRDVAAREAIAADLLARGPDAARALAPVARSEFARLEKSYASRFQRAASDTLAARLRGGEPTDEVGRLRRTIFDVAAQEALTAETIAARSDPALARLEALLATQPTEVLDGRPDVAADRAALLLLADVAQRCDAMLPEADRRPRAATPEPSAAAVAAIEETACLLGRALSPADRQTVLGNASLARNLDPEEAAGITRLNSIRILVGLPAQAVDPNLVAACRSHSRDMEERGFFAHESPVPGRETPWKRAQAAGTSASAENIFSGADGGAEAIEAWWHSPGHHKNLLGPHRRTGLGRWRDFWTQLFD